MHACLHSCLPSGISANLPDVLHSTCYPNTSTIITLTCCTPFFPNPQARQHPSTMAAPALEASTNIGSQDRTLTDRVTPRLLTTACTMTASSTTMVVAGAAGDSGNASVVVTGMGNVTVTVDLTQAQSGADCDNGTYSDPNLTYNCTLPVGSNVLKFSTAGVWVLSGSLPLPCGEWSY